MAPDNKHQVFPKIGDIAHMDVISASENTTVEDAIEIMANNNIRDVVFYDSANECHNIFMVKDLFNIIHREANYSCQLKNVTTRKLHCFKHDDNILEIYPNAHMKDEYFGVLNDEGALCGIVSYTDITSSIDPNILVEKKAVGEVLSKTPITTITPDTPTLDAFFHLNHADDAIVMLEARKPRGILTTKDMINIIRRKADTSIPVSAYMTSPVDTVHMDMTIKEVLHYLREKEFKRAVVVDSDTNLLGAVTQRDLAGYAYSHWAELMRSHANELHEVVGMLEDKASSFELASLTDSLTGIGNRNSFNKALTSEVGRFYRYGTGTFALLMLDIDHFKLVNDQHGHLNGDEVLKCIVQIVRSMIRDSDIFARWGGEEFVLLLPLTGLKHAEDLAERIRVRISETSFQPAGKLTVSLGVGQYRESESAEEFTSRVDKALYLAKNTGRNNVKVAA
jgi:diguanylate cyclase (GGDEF)-like protein